MKDPAPEFNASQYDRPNQNWLCGKACEGKPCRPGPDSHGHCRVTCECQPVLKIKPGETKGHYHCTRPRELGGPCAGGPLPGGACSRPLARCVPVRSLRVKRRIFTLATIIVTTGILLAALCGSKRWDFISPGDLSMAHSNESFARRAGRNNNCEVCHGAARGGITSWVKSAFRASPGPFQFASLMRTNGDGMTVIDHNCLTCHVGRSFHEPDVVREESCSACHVEHRGPGPMAAPDDSHCISCHGSAAVMEQSLALAKKLPPGAFNFRPNQGRVVFRAPRPRRGYTEVIHSFATDHPEFQVLREHLRDPDTLKFNHQLHLDASRVTWRGKKLECADCHTPDAAGVYHLKITYAQNCQRCHKLQFDVRNPGLLLPHGNTETVRAFLRALPQQYADYSARLHGGPDEPRDNAFAQEQMRALQSDFVSGEALERSVFFNEKTGGPVERVGAAGGAGPAMFPGCAYCHDVHLTASGAPRVVPPVIPDRWLVRGNFDHSKHLQNIRSFPKMDCATCHDAGHSRSTADILLPSKQTCVRCHSPAGGVASACATCHSYHSARKESPLAALKNFNAPGFAEISRKAGAFPGR